MAQKFFYAALLLGIVVCSPTRLLAIPIEAIPHSKQHREWVTDRANLLDVATEQQLDRMISELEAKNGSEIVIITVPDTAPAASPKAFATQLFNRWGIGKKDRNNGVLFLISQHDRRVEIETGSGLATQLPNLQVGQIIRSDVSPQFRQGHFNQGTIAGTRALISELAKQPPPTASASNETLLQHEFGLSGMVLGGLGVLCVFWSSFFLLRWLLAQKSRQKRTKPSLGSPTATLKPSKTATEHRETESQSLLSESHTASTSSSWSSNSSSHDSGGSSWSSDSSSSSDSGGSSSWSSDSGSSSDSGGSSSGGGGGDSW